MKRHGSRANPLIVPHAELGAPGQPVWVAEHAEAPHRREEIKGEPSAEKALAVVQRMALPGFVSADQRSRAVGMVAVGYGLKSARTARPHRSRRHAALLLPRLPGRRPRPGGFAGSRFQRTVGAHRGEFRVREWVHDNRPAAQVAPGLELVGWFSE
jgi:hypothetical protein